MPKADDVKVFVKNYLRDRLAKAGYAEPEDDLSLTDSGVIDSFGLLDLVTAAERKFAIQVDMDTVDLAAFTTFGGFVEALARAE